MAILDRNTLRRQAESRLNAAPNGGRLALIFVCVTAALSLAASIVSMVLDGQIAGTGGLGGMQLRSTLSTIQAVLNIALLVFVPFWNLGYTSVALKLGRGEAAGEKDLLNGFRRFGPALRLMLLRQVVNFAVFFVAAQLASIVFSYTPWATPFLQQLENTGLIEAVTEVDEATMDSLIFAMVPYWIIAGVIYLAVLLPVTYRLRMAEYRIMDDPKCGAVMAMFESNRMMKGHCLALLKLDLGFWWYYLAYILVPVLCYGDVLLPLVGIALPFDPTVSFFLFYVVAQIAQILLYWRCRNQVECTYVGAYDTMRSEMALPAQPHQSAAWNE